jgi:hypothetical protein
MRYCQSFQQIHCQLLQHLNQNTLLLVHCFLVSPEEPSFRILLEAYEDLLLDSRERHGESLIVKISRWRTVVIVGLSIIDEGVASH